MKVKVFKDDEGILRPFAGIWPAEGRMAEFTQPDIDKFMEKKGRGGKVVECDLIEYSSPNSKEK